MVMVMVTGMVGIKITIMGMVTGRVMVRVKIKGGTV